MTCGIGDRTRLCEWRDRIVRAGENRHGAGGACSSVAGRTLTDPKDTQCCDGRSDERCAWERTEVKSGPERRAKMLIRGKGNHSAHAWCKRLECGRVKGDGRTKRMPNKEHRTGRHGAEQRLEKAVFVGAETSATTKCIAVPWKIRENESTGVRQDGSKPSERVVARTREAVQHHGCRRSRIALTDIKDRAGSSLKGVRPFTRGQAPRIRL